MNFKKNNSWGPRMYITHNFKFYIRHHESATQFLPGDDRVENSLYNKIK